MSPELSLPQPEALQELIKMGCARASAALSDLSRHAVRMETPSVSVHPGKNTAAAINQQLKGRLVSVKQAFHGPVTGDIFLIFDERAMRTLTDAASGSIPETPAGERQRRDDIAEIGHILISAHLGALGNVLKFHLTFAAPKLAIGDGDMVAQSVYQSSLGLGEALMVPARLRNLAGEACGNIVLLLGFISLSQLMAQIEAWDRRNRF